MVNSPAVVRNGWGSKIEGVRELWAWCVSMVTFTGAWFLNLENWLALLGIIVAVLTAAERIYAIKLRREQIRNCRPAPISNEE